MKRFADNTCPFTNIILMTSHGYAECLKPFLFAKNPNIFVLNLVHPNEIDVLSDEFLMSSRLISFGTRYYIPAKILARIGYGSYNFHPGSVEYPGWAPFLYALYHGAKKYGVTVHEMSPKIDAGKIISVVDFDVPDQINPQELVDLTVMHMFNLFKELSGDFVNKLNYLEIINVEWRYLAKRKKDFDEICNIPLDVSEYELKRRIFAFGDSDGEIFPYIMVDEKKYRIAFNDDHPDRYSYWLHGVRFVIQ